MSDLRVVTIPRQDPRLGRIGVFDERSRDFPLNATVDTSTWRTKSVRLYDPRPLPRQPRGNCTGCGKTMQFNAVGNRIKGQVLTMEDADRIYALATTLDPFPGAWPPHDTGSSLLAACKASVQLGLGGEYRWLFGGADEVIQAVMEGHAVNVGTRWTHGMFEQDAQGRIEPTGSNAGGHAWVVKGFNEYRDWAEGKCWWGDRWREFWIKREHLNDLLLDNGDANVQIRAGLTLAA